MENIWKKITHRSLKYNLIVALALLVIGAVLLMLKIPETSRYLLAREDFQTNLDDVLHSARKYYVCNDNSIIDWYATNDEGIFYVTQVSEGTGEPYYMGIYLPYEYSHKANKIIDEVTEYYNGGAVPQTHITGRGFVRDMESLERQFINDYFAGAPEEITSHIVYKTFIYLPYKDVITVPSAIFLIIGGIMFTAAVFLIINVLSGYYCLELKHYLKARGKSREQFSDEMRDSITFANDRYYCAKDYMVVADHIIKVFEYKDILMVTPNIFKTNHYNYGVYSNTTENYRVLLSIAGVKENKVLQVSSWQEALSMCRYIVHNAPAVRFADPEKKAEEKAGEQAVSKNQTYLFDSEEENY